MKAWIAFVSSSLAGPTDPFPVYLQMGGSDGPQGRSGVAMKVRCGKRRPPLADGTSFPGNGFFDVKVKL